MIDRVPAPAVPSPPWWRRPGVLLVALALAAYTVVLVRHVEACAAGSDASGYSNHARLLAAGRLHGTPRPVSSFTPEDQRSMLFIPLGFVPAPDGNGMVPTYPAGLPLLVAAAAPLVGWKHAGDVVLCVHALLGVLLTCALGRAMGLSRRGAVLGAAIVAASPLYLNYSIQLMSDLPALVWTMAAVLAAWRSRERALWALAAGAAAAVAVLIRPTNALVFAPVAIALGLSPRRWLLLIAGGLPGAVFFGLDNLSLYGHVFATGYGNFSGSFDHRWIGVTAWHYALWLPVFFSPVVLLVPGLPWLARTEPCKAALLGVWALVFAAFYSTYDCTHQTWWYLRFLLPAVPPLVVGGLLVARMTGIGRRWPLLQTRVFAFAMAVILANSIFWTGKLWALNSGHDGDIYPVASAWLQANLPGDAVIVSMQMSGALSYYTGFTFLRWDFCDADKLSRILAAMRDSHRPFYAALFSFETAKAFQRLPGRWTQIATVRTQLEVWRYDFDDAPPPPKATPRRFDEAPAFVWRLPIDQAPSRRRAWLLANGIAWVVLAGLLWRLIPGNDWRDWVARAGILLSAGAIGSLRFALTDLIGLAVLAGALLAMERRRHGWAVALLGAAGAGRASTLFALPAFSTTPWFSRSNLRRWLPVSALAAVSTAAVWWRLGSVGPLDNPVTWPLRSFLDGWMTGVTSLLQGQGLGLAWFGLAVLFSVTVQAACFLRQRREADPWWRLGLGYLVLLCFLDDAMWRGAAGGATRLLLPLTLAFNVLARRTRAAPAWLLAGNLAVVAGLPSLCFPPDSPDDMAPVRAAGFAQLSGAGSDWIEGGRTPRHIRSWSRGTARLAIEAWPHGAETLVANFSLQSPNPRTVIIRQDGRELWRGAVGAGFTPVQVSCRLAGGRAWLDLATDSPAVPEGAGPDAPPRAFAIFDPVLAAAEP